MSTQLLKVQEILVELLVNPIAYRSFVSDPGALSQIWGLEADTSKKLSEFDPKEISTFREIVTGTRALRFAELLPRLRRNLGENWQEYISRFFDSVAIRDSKNENDVRLFVEFIENQCPDNRVTQCARLEFALLSISNKDAAEANSDSVEINLDYDLNSLLSGDLEATQLVPRAKYRLSRNVESGEIDVFQAEAP